MQDFPHHYQVSATAETTSHVELRSEGLSPIESAPPPEFGGPGDRWSPESLLVAAVADCFVLSFKAIAGASRLEWNGIHCDVDGVLDKLDGKMRFTEFKVSATLSVPNGTDQSKAARLLEKAEHACLITNSLIADRELTTKITVAN
ncbi:MAG: OsmC family protein [Gammaproteobacteria bacterium]|nr:OsmC family protein [Gammaproteobacteria bacterium]